MREDPVNDRGLVEGAIHFGGMNRARHSAATALYVHDAGNQKKSR
jgi:hypothetical protein